MHLLSFFYFTLVRPSRANKRELLPVESDLHQCARKFCFILKVSSPLIRPSLNLILIIKTDSSTFRWLYLRRNDAELDMWVRGLALRQPLEVPNGRDVFRYLARRRF